MPQAQSAYTVQVVVARPPGRVLFVRWYRVRHGPLRWRVLPDSLSRWHLWARKGDVDETLCGLEVPVEGMPAGDGREVYRLEFSFEGQSPAQVCQNCLRNGIGAAVMLGSSTCQDRRPRRSRSRSRRRRLETNRPHRGGKG